MLMKNPLRPGGIVRQERIESLGITSGLAGHD